MDTACGTQTSTHTVQSCSCTQVQLLPETVACRLSPVACLDLVVDMPHAYSCRDPKHTITITANSHTIVATKSGPTAAQISAQFKPENSRAPLLPGPSASQPASALSPAPSSFRSPAALAHLSNSYNFFGFSLFFSYFLLLFPPLFVCVLFAVFCVPANLLSLAAATVAQANKFIFISLP